MFSSCKYGGKFFPEGQNATVYSVSPPITNPLTATALIYAFGAGITAGAGTRLVLQLLLDIGWH